MCARAPGKRRRDSSFEADAEIRTENRHLFILLYSKLPSDSHRCTHKQTHTHVEKKTKTYRVYIFFQNKMHCVDTAPFWSMTLPKIIELIFYPITDFSIYLYNQWHSYSMLCIALSCIVFLLFNYSQLLISYVGSLTLWLSKCYPSVNVPLTFTRTSVGG